MRPIEVVLPPGSLLDPHKDVAVVGGNVLTSQRIVDVILRAFGVCAASQVRILYNPLHYLITSLINRGV